MTIMSPPLALGQTVHQVIETLSTLPIAGLFAESLMVKFERSWQKVSGMLGGFQKAGRGNDVASYEQTGTACQFSGQNQHGPSLFFPFRGRYTHLTLVCSS